MKGKMKFDGKKGFIIAIIMVVLVVGYYYYLSNYHENPKEEDVVVTEVQDLLLRDLERNYPPSPKEVVKYYFDITKCLYNEKLSNEDVEALALRLEDIFDDELAAHQVRDEYFADLKNEIAAFQGGNNLILNYSTSASTEVDYFEMDGQEYARLYGTFYLHVQKSMHSMDEVFILRRDENGRWKIYGWEPIEERTTLDVEE